MNHAEQILTALDRKLDRKVELTLYGGCPFHRCRRKPPAS